MNSRSTHKGKSKEWVLSVIGSMIIVALCAILLIPGFGVVFRSGPGATTAEAAGPTVGCVLCVGGFNDGDPCTTNFDCLNACVGGTNPGTPCISDLECEGGGTCTDVGACAGPPGCTLAVTLGWFTVTPQGLFTAIEWETVSEIDTLGFNLYRGTEPDVVGAMLNFVPSQAPGSGQGAVYEYQDATVQVGQTYYYWLEDVDLNGATTLHGPVSVTVTQPTAVTLTTTEAASLPTQGVPAYLLVGTVVGLALAAGYATRASDAGTLSLCPHCVLTILVLSGSFPLGRVSLACRAVPIVKIRCAN